MRVSSPVFVGRDEELATLGAALERAAGGQAQTVLLAGDSGVGKTRLLAEFKRSPGGRRANWLAGGCIAVAEGDLPYAPIIAALRSVRSESVDPDQIAESAPELARLVPSLGAPEVADPAQSGGGNPSASLRGEFAQGRLFEQVLALLTDLSADQPVVLAVEDLHWADRSTRNLLSFLIHNIQGEGVLVICTFRTDELHRGHPLRPFLAEHERLRWVERVELRTFTQSELNAQLAGILGGPPELEFAVRLFERSEGNAFFSEELLAASAAGDAQLPQTIRDALMLRVEALSTPTQEVLRAAAVVGRRVTHPLLAAVADLPEAELTPALREAVAHQLLAQDADGASYAFRHALLAETILADLLPGERTRLHLAVAEALSADSGLGPDSAGNTAAELAFHWRACHRLEEALTSSVEAGLQAESSCAFAEASRQFESALELWERVGDAERRAGMDHPAMLLRAAQNASLNGQAHRAVALARSAVDETDPAADSTRAGLARERLGEFLWLAGDSEGAIEVLREAVGLLPSEPPGVERARVLAAEARILVLHGRAEESRARCEEAIAIARGLDAHAEEGHALNTLGLCLLLAGERTGAIARLNESRRIAEECSPEDLWRAYANLGEALEQEGRIEEAVELGIEGAELVRPLGQRNWEAYILGQVASQLVRLGRLDEAEELVATGLRTHIEGIDTAILKSVASEINLLRGDLEAAETELQHAVRAAGPTTDWAIRAMLADRHALVAVLSGDPDRAVGIVDEAIRSMHSGEYVFYTARIYALGVRAHADRAERARALGDAETTAEAERSGSAIAERLQRLLDSDGWQGSPPPESVARAALAAAELERLRGAPNPRAWSVVAARWADLGLNLELAYARWRQAEAVLAAGGAKADASEPLREAARLSAESGASLLGSEIERLARRARIDLGDHDESSAAESPAPPSDHFGLTRRELDVLALVAEGRTNREIGEALFISTKTASAHVSHILSKLEVRSRIEAATTAHRLGLVPEKSG
jgi:DNA-binding CsgD family transcriptional regulator/tetratricopeptide (TPR) repeat protein